MMFDDLPPPPDGFTLDATGAGPSPRAPVSRAPRIVPVDNAAAIIRAIYPNVQITDWARDPNSALGRSNPNSWHVRTRAAIDNRPLPGMTYEQFRQGIEDRGYHIIEGIDEVHHPSRHATGPHWHDVLGYDPSNPPLDPTANMHEQSGDAPPAALPPPPAGFALDAPPPPQRLLNIGPPALPGAPGLAGSTPPLDPDTQAAIQSLAPPPASGPRVTDPLSLTAADARARNQTLTAGAPPPPSGYQADPNNVATQHSAPANRVPTAQVTTRDDPRLAGANSQLAGMLSDPSKSRREIEQALIAFGSDPASPSIRRTLDWRDQNLALWLRTPANQRRPFFVNVDDVPLPAGQYREVTANGNVPQATITNAPPPVLSQRIATALERPAVAAGIESERSAAVAAQQNQQILGHPLSPIRAIEDAQDATTQEQRALLEGRYLDAQGHHLAAGVAMLGAVPFGGGGARAGETAAAKALAEVEALALRNGVRAAGPAADAAVARIATERFGELSPEAQGVLRDISRPAEGEAPPTELSALHLGDLRAAANPRPSIIQRGVQAIRDRMGGGGEPPAPRVPDRIEIPPSPSERGPVFEPSSQPGATGGDDPFDLSQAEHDDLMDVTPEELRAHAQLAWEHFRAKEIGAYRAADEAAAMRDEGTGRWIGNEHELINRLMDETAPGWREPDRLAMPPAVPAGVDLARLPPPPAGFALDTPRAPPSAVGGRELVGELPAEGVAPANVGTDGRLYVGGMGEAHFDVINRFPEGTWSGETGFVTPDGRFLNRTEALDYVNSNGERIRPSENMRGGPGGDELDALDYRDQSGMVPPPQWSTRRAEWDRQAALRRGASAPASDNLPPPPPGFTLEDPLGRVPPIGEQPSPEAMADLARSIRPEDVTPIPNNRIGSAEEAAAANPGTIRNLDAPDPATMLEMRTVRRADGRDVRYRGPIDAEAFLRLRGGLRDDQGELRHLGITNNAPRPEAPREHILGPILNRNGLTLDGAGEALHEAGYFNSRPTTADVVDMIRESRLGRRLWHSDDLGEVAAFHGALDQQQAVEAAADAGRPLAERIGSPVGPHDLAANDPPAIAYEDLPNIGGKVGNINLAHIESGADIGRLLDTVERKFGGFDAARRGVITHAETEALAGELGMTADDLLRRRRGQALNAEQALAARQILAKSADEVVGLAGKATGPDASEAARAAFAEALLRHAAIHEQVTGAVAEAGRALSAMRAQARSRAISGEIHRLAVEDAGGEKRLDEIARGILDLQRQGVGPGGVNRFAVDAIKPQFRDKLIELWMFNLLSGLKTHAVNITSNLMTAALQIPEHATAAAFGAVRRGFGRALGREDDFDRVMGSEIGARAFGMMSGAREGLGAFGHTIMTGQTTDFVSKVPMQGRRAISGIGGRIVRAPTTLLTAEDEFFKAIGRRMELNGLAVRQARSEKLTGQAFRDRVADLSENPTESMIDRSMNYARYVTFQSPLEPGSLAQGIGRLTQNRPWLKLFVPFVRTPANLLKFAVERAPAALLLGSVRRDFAAGGARRDLAIARMMLGTGLGLTVAELASRGAITGGGPVDRGARELMLADGWQPYSIKVNGTYYSYARLDPISTTLGVAADMVDFGSHMTPGQRQEAAPLLLASIIRNLGNKTWLSGISDVVSAIDDPQRSLPNLVARLGGSVAVPAIVSQTASVVDPTMRDAHRPSFSTDAVPDALGFHSLLDQTLGQIQSRIPGLSSSLPARQDVWGRPVVREGALGPDLISPFTVSTARNDPINAEMLRLGVNIGRPAGQIHIEGVAVPLTPRQRANYGAMSGRYMRDDLRDAMADPGWQDMTREEQLSAIAGIKRTARADARVDLGLDGGQAAAPSSLPPPPSGFTLSH